MQQGILRPCEFPWEMIWWWESENAGAATSRPWGWPSHHLGEQEQPAAPGWAAHAASPTPGISSIQGMWGQWGIISLEHGSLPGAHGCLCDFPSYQPLATSEEVDKLTSTVKSQERSPCARVLLLPDNWITGTRNWWTRDYSLLSLWSTTSADLPSTLLLQTLHLPEGAK